MSGTVAGRHILFALGFFACMVLPVEALSAPLDQENYRLRSAPFADIPDGTIVEGSASHGGIQPDYIIDRDAPALNYLWSYARKLRKSTRPTWRKVDLIVKAVAKTLYKYKYDDPAYLNLVNSYRLAGRDVPISEYAACRAGVCRENAILTHLALKEAGIPNFHVYAQVENIYGQAASGKIENHGFVVFELDGKRWIADSYWAQYNGYNFDELLRPNRPATADLKLRLPFAVERPSKRRIVSINAFPRMWVPKNASVNVPCSKWFRRIAQPDN